MEFSCVRFSGSGRGVLVVVWRNDHQLTVLLVAVVAAVVVTVASPVGRETVAIMAAEVTRLVHLQVQVQSSS